MNDRWTDSLSDYLDEELEPSERAAIEIHLRDCADCAATLAALRRVVGRAQSLSEHTIKPDADLWPGISARIARRPPVIPISGGASWSERRVTFSVTQLAAACVALAVISGGAVWLARTTGQRDAGLLIPGSAPVGQVALAPAGSTPETSSAAVEELRQALARGQDDLDPATVRTLEESLMIIDVAIQQARRALAADPRNPYVREHLDETMRRKVDLLHRATMLASAPR
jgi:anti-sigma factor RsiW